MGTEKKDAVNQGGIEEKKKDPNVRSSSPDSQWGSKIVGLWVAAPENKCVSFILFDQNQITNIA